MSSPGLQPYHSLRGGRRRSVSGPRHCEPACHAPELGGELQGHEVPPHRHHDMVAHRPFYRAALELPLVVAILPAAGDLLRERSTLACETHLRRHVRRLSLTLLGRSPPDAMRGAKPVATDGFSATCSTRMAPGLLPCGSHAVCGNCFSCAWRLKRCCDRGGRRGWRPAWVKLASRWPAGI